MDSSCSNKHFDHKVHMSKFLSRLLTTNSKIIAEEKFNSIVRQLQHPQTKTVPPSLKFWIKKKGLRLLNMPELELVDVLVMPKQGTCATASASNFHMVVHSGALYDVIRKLHTSKPGPHCGYKRILNTTDKDYYGIPRSYIQEFCRTCPVCHKKSLPDLMEWSPEISAVPKRAQLKECHPKNPIPLETEFLHRIHINLIDLSNTPDMDFHYIGHVVDYFSNFQILFPLKTGSAVEVASMIKERVLGYLGTPLIFHSDSGREFVDQVLRALFEQWSGDTIFINGMSEHSQSQILKVKKTRLLDKLIKMKEDYRASNSLNSVFPWSSSLPRLMFLLNTETPYEIVFGRKARGNVYSGAAAGVVHEENLQRIVTDASSIHDGNIADRNIAENIVYPAPAAADVLEENLQIIESHASSNDNKNNVEKYQNIAGGVPSIFVDENDFVVTETVAIVDC